MQPGCLCQPAAARASPDSRHQHIVCPQCGTRRKWAPPFPARCDTGSGGPLMFHPPLILLFRGWEVPSYPTAISCSHIIIIQSHCKPLGQQDWPEGDSAASWAAPLPRYDRPSGDRTGGGGISPRHSILLQTHMRAAKPQSPTRAWMFHTHLAASHAPPTPSHCP